MDNRSPVTAATNISRSLPMAESRSPTPASVWRNPIHFLAFGFGSGAMPRAPGTWGTLAALPFVLLWQQLPVGGYALVLLLSTLLGIWLCHRTAADLGVHDHGGIVWDEFVGLWIALCLAPPGWLWLLAGFVLFRLFDIWKPWPIGWVDRRVGGGSGRGRAWQHRLGRVRRAVDRSVAGAPRLAVAALGLCAVPAVRYLDPLADRLGRPPGWRRAGHHARRYPRRDHGSAGVAGR